MPARQNLPVAPDPNPVIVAEQAGVEYVYACWDDMRRTTPSAGEFAASAGAPKAGAALFSAGAAKNAMYDSPEDSLVLFRVVSEAAEDEDADENQEFYVGRQAVRDPDLDLLVVGWDSDQGMKWFRASERERNGLLFKREITCRDRRVTQYRDLFGNDPGAAGFDTAAESGTEWIDPLLTELARGRDSSMRDIIATIQREQLEIVDDPHEGVLVVQGGPGSGKTAVGIPRIARMLRRSGSPLRRDRILVLGPSQRFVQYLAGAFASLGVDDIRRDDLPNLWNARDADHDTGLVGKLKSGPRMAAVLRRALEDCIANPEVRVARFCRNSDVFSLAFRGTWIEVPVASILKIFTEEMDADAPYNDRAARWRSRFVALLNDVFRRDHPKIEEDYSEKIREKCERDELFDVMTPKLNPGDVLQRLLRSEVVLRRVCSGIATEEELHQLRDRVDRYKRRRWTYEDRVCLQELRYLLQGAEPKSAWDHLVIDEAQNVTPMEARELARRCSSGSMTVMGDLAQRLAPYPYLDWEELARTLAPRSRSKVVELQAGFRLPPQIMELAAPLGRRLSPGTAIPVAILPRDGDSVTTVRAEDPVAAAADRAAVLLRNEGAERSVAIIVPGRNENPRARDWETEIRAALEGRSSPELPVSPISVLTGREARGLEFDHVLIAEPRAFISASDAGEQELYIALTRATRTLTILHHDDLPGVLRPDAPEPPSFRLERARSEGRCTRFRRTGEQCEHPSAGADGWCRHEDCDGFPAPTPPHTGRKLGRIAKDGPFAEFTLPELPSAEWVQVSGDACEQFIQHHGGLRATAAAELRAMVPVFLQQGSIFKFPGLRCVIRHRGVGLVLSADRWEVIGYDTGQPDLTYSQIGAGVRPRQQAAPMRQDPDPVTIEEAKNMAMADAEQIVEWSAMTADDFESMRITERIQTEREDPDHEILRSQIYSDLQRRRKVDGGKAGQEDGVDAWYELDGVTTVFEVLEVSGFDYGRFRRGAVDLLEVSYMRCRGGKAVMVLVSQQPPEEPWTIKALKNIFDVLVAWPEGGSWAGPGAPHLLPRQRRSEPHEPDHPERRRA
jgi:DNA helicase IV